MTPSKPWYEELFKGLYGELLPGDPNAERSIREAKLIRRVLRLRKGQRVLDVPCGKGRITVALTKAGMEMTGVDLCERYVRRARRTARAEGVDVRFIRRDMREIDFDGEFHAACNWFTSIGYASDADDLEFCRRVHRALRPGGRFLVECMNISALWRRFRARDEQTIGKVHIAERRRWNPRTRRMRSAWTFTKGTKSETHIIDLRLYTGTEMRRLLTRAGFRDIVLHGNPPLQRFTRHSRRLIAIGTRPT